MKTLKNLAAAVVISFIAAAGAQPVQAAEQANGIQINGFSLNGFSLNGLKRNGFVLNGFVLNGLPVAGHSLEAAQVIAVTLPESVAR